MPETAIELPKGFHIDADESGHLTITYRTAGMGCLHSFLAILLLGIGGGFGLVAYHDPAEMRHLTEVIRTGSP